MHSAMPTSLQYQAQKIAARYIKRNFFLAAYSYFLSVSTGGREGRYSLLLHIIPLHRDLIFKE